MANDRIPRIIITPGEPAGIGPDITIQIAQQEWSAELIVVGDAEALQARAKLLELPLSLLPADLAKPAIKHQPGHLKVISVPLNAPCIPGQLNRENAHYVIRCIELATELCLQKKVGALVTGPVQKSIINEAKIAFSGHTEFLASLCHAKESMMLFVVDKLKVALATTHVPLSRVPSLITKEKIISTLRLLHSELQKKFSIANPQILVCGLNPHAGENGHFGREEMDIIEPAIRELRAENLNVIGPLPADTIFTEKHLHTADAILAMYHDQALPVVKYMGFDRAVNVTLGLPIIRTSVDHGTALELAGTNQANPGSLAAAIHVAINLQ